ncbi:MAG: GtrA family protein [Ruminococcaceae bacterium]|nr:GtrA family protein [Oscillospiraceae bacterium]
MMNNKKIKMLLLYVIFGVGTTIVNLLLFQWLYYGLGAGTVVSNVLAWVGAVLFAFVTNKWFVFESKKWNLKLICKELSSFAGCRCATGLLDLVAVYITVDLLHQEAMHMKIIINILVIILNYVASKIIFRKKEE